MYNYIGLEPRREAMHWQFGEMKFGEKKRNTSNWSNFGMLLRRAGLTASAGLSCYSYYTLLYRYIILC